MNKKNAQKYLLKKEEWNVVKPYYDEVNNAWENCSNIKNIPNAEMIKLDSINTIYKAQVKLMKADKQFNYSENLNHFRKEFITLLNGIIKILDRVVSSWLDNKVVNYKIEKINLKKAIRRMDKKISTYKIIGR